MFNVKWDSEINGILLTNEFSDLIPPRPVFAEELDLLGFNKHWKYPNENNSNPLLWASGRRYFYKGNLVATTKKGDMYNLPSIVFEDGYEKLELEEIDIEKVIERNMDLLFVLENDAIDFIEEIYSDYSDYPFSISFSGGKDSQAVLDLVTRVIDSDNMVVIFSDTTLESKFTYNIIDETKVKYRESFPNLKFKESKPIKPFIELVDDLGLPSRFIRWCTSILKTVPFNKLINELVDADSKIIVFEGVRSEESPKRSKYNQIANGVKHSSVINVRPILYWNFSEVVLYNFYRNLPMNKLYKYGLSRVGCEICPFATPMSECIHSHIDEGYKNKYVPLLEEYIKNSGLKERKDIDKAILEGNWKKRAGGKNLSCKSTVNFLTTSNSFKAVLVSSTTNFLEWIKILGNVSYYKKNKAIEGELNLEGNFIPFLISTKKNKEIIEFFGIKENKRIQSKIKKILRKTTFCIGCGLCDVECPNNALKTSPVLFINSELCENCENCLDVNGHGCIRARSFEIGSGGRKMNKKTSGIDKYSSFGLRVQWLEEFLESGNNWLDDNTLGTKQIPAVKNWLFESGFLDKDKSKTSNEFEILKEIYINNPLFIWGIIWINLYYESKIVRWYCDNVDWGSYMSKNELLEKLMDDLPDFKKGTLNNPLTALFNTFENSPLNEYFNVANIKKEGRTKFIDKEGLGNNEIDPLLIAYCLYKLKENISRSDFTVSELYDEKFEGSPYKIFGISKEEFERVLRGLQQSNEKIIKSDLVSDLDNIFLKEDISSSDIINLKNENSY